MSSLFAIVLAFVTALVVTGYLSRPGSRWRILDRPNARSLHQQPMPRTGGLAILAGGIVGQMLLGFSLLAAGFHTVELLLGLLPLAVVSLLDDRHAVSVKGRITVHIWAACSVIYTGYGLHSLDLPGFALTLPSWIAIPLTLLFTVWMINLYNFMDGMDGFAGGMAVIGFSTLAWLGRADAGYAAFCLTVAAASAGFLVHNFPPAKIFLGDTGSTTLGFLVAACGLWGGQAGLFPFWVVLLVFSPFIVDATVTLLRRLLRGERIWEAHRTHYYQRLVLLGWGHRRTVLAEYGLMLACTASALLAVRMPPAGQMVLAVGWIVIYGLLMWGVGRLEPRHPGCKLYL